MNLLILYRIPRWLVLTGLALMFSGMTLSIFMHTYGLVMLVVEPI